jgi:hypothetical protein
MNNRFSRHLHVALWPRLLETVQREAARRAQTPSEYARQSLLLRLKHDGVGLSLTTKQIKPAEAASP